MLNDTAVFENACNLVRACTIRNIDGKVNRCTAFPGDVAVDSKTGKKQKGGKQDEDKFAGVTTFFEPFDVRIG